MSENLFDMAAAAAEIANETDPAHVVGESESNASNETFDVKYNNWSNTVYGEICGWGPTKLEIMQTEADQRFSTALPLSRVKSTTVALIGAGGLGNWIWRVLLGMGFQNIVIFDDDTVGIENIGPQAHNIIDIGLPKVEAVRRAALAFRGINLRVVNKRAGDLLDIAEQCGGVPDVIIGATDNTEWRNQLIDDLLDNTHTNDYGSRYQACKQVSLFIDLRMSLGDWHCFVWTPKLFTSKLASLENIGTTYRSIQDAIRKAASHYKELAVFEPDEAIAEPCTARAITYTGANVASYVGAFLHWWLAEGRTKSYEWFISDFYRDTRDGTNFNWFFTNSSREFQAETRTTKLANLLEKSSHALAAQSALYNQLEQGWGRATHDAVAKNNMEWYGKRRFMGLPRESITYEVQEVDGMWVFKRHCTAFYVLGVDGKQYIAYRCLIPLFETYMGRVADPDTLPTLKIYTQVLFSLDDSTAYIDLHSIDSNPNSDFINDINIEMRHGVYEAAVLPLCGNMEIGVPLPGSYANPLPATCRRSRFRYTGAKLLPLVGEAARIDDYTAVTKAAVQEMCESEYDEDQAPFWESDAHTVLASYNDYKNGGGQLRCVWFLRDAESRPYVGYMLRLVPVRTEACYTKYATIVHKLVVTNTTTHENPRWEVSRYTCMVNDRACDVTVTPKRATLQQLFTWLRDIAVDPDYLDEGDGIMVAPLHFMGNTASSEGEMLEFAWFELTGDVWAPHMGADGSEHHYSMFVTGLPVPDMRADAQPEENADAAEDTNIATIDNQPATLVFVHLNGDEPTTMVTNLALGSQFAVPGFAHVYTLVGINETTVSAIEADTENLVVLPKTIEVVPMPARHTPVHATVLGNIDLTPDMPNAIDNTCECVEGDTHDAQ